MAVPPNTQVQIADDVPVYVSIRFPSRNSLIRIAQGEKKPAPEERASIIKGLLLSELKSFAPHDATIEITVNDFAP